MKLCMGCMDAYEDEYNICPHCGYGVKVKNQNLQPQIIISRDDSEDIVLILVIIFGVIVVFVLFSVFVIR